MKLLNPTNVMTRQRSAKRNMVGTNGFHFFSCFKVKIIFFKFLQFLNFFVMKGLLFFTPYKIWKNIEQGKLSFSL